ncbi:DUF2232 domain-containing protein [Thomasclavelia sp.]
MSGSKVKIMAQGAMIASLFGVLGIINIYTGSIFDIILAYIMVLGLAYYTYLYDYKAGLSVLVVTFVVLFLVGEIFFTFYASSSLLMGVFYGYCLRNQKSKGFAKYGLMIISAIKNFLIFFLLGSILGINVYQEGLEIYRDIIGVIPGVKNVITPEVTFGLLWLFMFICESYVIRVYSDILIGKMMKRK